MLCERLEQFRHILTCLCRCLQVVAKVLLSSKLKCLAIGHLTLFFQICEVANKIDDDVGSCVVTHFLEPLCLDIIKALATSNVKDEENTT